MEDLDKVVITENGSKTITDKSQFPVIEINSLEDIFLLESIDSYREKYFKTYSFYNIPVPRVSNILQECINKEFLVKWAASIGAKAMNFQRTRATTIGSIVHEMIECHLLNKDLPNYKDGVNKTYIDPIELCYNNFLDWENNLKSMGYNIEEIVGVEIPVVCPYYGGTIDCVMKINGKYYVIDFKTSKSISYEYVIQTTAYLWCINNGYTNLPFVDGIGIIRVDKESKKFEDYFLNLHIPEQKVIIDYFINGFGALLNSYYNLINMRNNFYSYRKTYDFETCINGGE